MTQKAGNRALTKPSILAAPSPPFGLTLRGPSSMATSSSSPPSCLMVLVFIHPPTRSPASRIVTLVVGESVVRRYASDREVIPAPRIVTDGGTRVILSTRSSRSDEGGRQRPASKHSAAESEIAWPSEATRELRALALLPTRAWLGCRKGRRVWRTFGGRKADGELAGRELHHRTSARQSPA